MTTFIAEPRVEPQSLGRIPAWAYLVVAYIGVTFAIFAYLTIFLPFVNSYFLALAFAGWLGWRVRFRYAPLRAYLIAAGALSFFTLLSGVALWDRKAVLWAVSVAVWVLVITPGFAFVLADPRLLRAFVTALGIGMATYGFFRILWMITGHPPSPELLQRGGDGSIQWFLRSNRDELDAISLMTLPLLFLDNRGLRVRGRYVMGALILFWLLSSGGRQGPVFLALIALAYPVLVPGLGRRVRALAVAVLVGCFVVLAFVHLGETSSVGRNRVTALVSGQRTPSDEQRAILNARAWHLGWQNPFFGHGYSRLLGTSDPALNRARTARQAQAAQAAAIHNLYLWWFQSIGVPGTLAYLAIFGLVLLALVRAREHRDVRLATLSYLTVLGSIGFHTAHHDLPYLSIIVSLAVLAAQQRHEGVDA